MADSSKAPAQGAGMDQKEKDSRLWGMLCHLAALAFFIPFGHIVGPLVVWLVKRNEIPFVDEQGKESLNFQITMTIYGVIAALLMLVFIGMLLFPALLIFDLVMIIQAAIKANSGQSFRYPLCIRLIK